MFKISRLTFWSPRLQVINLRQSSSVKNSDVNSKAVQQQRFNKHRNTELYPYRFEYNSDISTFRDKYQNIRQSETLQEEIKLTGMITSFRDYGKKLKFLDIERNGQSLQLKISREYFNGEMKFSDISELFSKGDKVGVTGQPTKTKSGELSLLVSKIKLLAPCLRNLPATNYENSNKRFKKRYLDFMINLRARDIIITRAKIIRYIRRFLEERSFLEVETPKLGLKTGGANARPFYTWHNDLEQKLSMRIAPELCLKQLIIGGLERVFEIGKLFRNEGVDQTHNPEFTSCELYQAYADYDDLIRLTEELLSGLVSHLHHSPRHQSESLDFSSPFNQIEFIPSLQSACNTIFPPPDQLASEDSVKFLKSVCQKNHVDTEGLVTAPRILDKLMGKMVEPELIQPTFLLHHPLIMSPLAKEHRNCPGLAERFELFIAGKEVANAYTELNDPELQRRALEAQLGLSDPEAMLPDEDFCVSLEYGLPPTAGLGVGIDRLVMILTQTPSIREVITFPLK